ncbi:IS630 family transposase [Geofilum rubicundum]|uniref:Mobile element protein n=1 Tax=Geofilum rubicundum JCM 15548 TaxID=1236989 RepID=A0A0E9LRL2_9BACT|nr:IS630 family transposase [Geofilum rubicundum]GAO27918.1 mobile element protein [Geofilum rubicundum JCM 15548]
MAEKEELLTMSRSRKLERRYVERAEIILLSDQGLSMDNIVEQTGLSKPVVNKWRQRFRQLGIDGLKDAPRSGKPRTITPEQQATVIDKACSKPDGGYTNWSQKRIADEVGISQSKVFQILKQADLKPHKIDYWCGKSKDPEFEEKMTKIVGLYMAPPENALVICVDEKTQIQALDRTQPELPLKSGAPKRQTATYKRNGTVSLIAALAVHSGEITAKTMKSNNAENFLKFLKALDRKYRNKKLHIIADNLSIHKHKDVQSWLAGKRKIQLHFTPTYSSWLNQVEIWFNILTKDVVKGGIWQSSEQLASQLMEYVKTYNNTRAKPFRWTYTGDALRIS